MRIKSYFADTVDEAMDKARREIGPDAMLLNSKRTEADLRSLGAYEVTFAIPPETVAARGPQTTRADFDAKPLASPAPEGRGMGGDLGRELAELRRQIEAVKRSVGGRVAGHFPALAAQRPDYEEILERLSAADMSQDLASELAAGVETRRSAEAPSGRTAAGLAAALRDECAGRLQFSDSLGLSDAAPRAVLLAGPAGVGKTTTLVKLALRYGLRARLPLQLLSLDTLRIGGWEQLAAYARIAGIPCQPIHTPAALEQAFAEYQNKRFLLIDTAGISPAGEASSRGLAAWLGAHRHLLDVQLVLSAVAQPRVQMAAVERFAGFAPAKLLLTHLDEAESSGPVLETALRAGLPLSFFATGQQVPEDLEAASLDRLVGPLAPGAETETRESLRIASAA